MSRPGNYSMNDNQNYFVDGGRTSSKVLKPPGGGSSIQLGWDTSNDKADNVGKPTVKHGGRSNQQMPYAEMQNSNPNHGYSSQQSAAPAQQYKQQQQQQSFPAQQLVRQSSWYNEQTSEGETSMFSDASRGNGSESFARRGASKKNMEVTGKIGAHAGAAPQQQQQYSQQYTALQSSSSSSQYQQQQQMGRGESSNRYANGNNQNVGNVITDRSSTRIHAPPGGYSSIHFG